MASVAASPPRTWHCTALDSACDRVARAGGCQLAFARSCQPPARATRGASRPAPRQRHAAAGRYRRGIPFRRPADRFAPFHPADAPASRAQARLTTSMRRPNGARPPSRGAASGHRVPAPVCVVRITSGRTRSTLGQTPEARVFPSVERTISRDTHTPTRTRDTNAMSPLRTGLRGSAPPPSGRRRPIGPLRAQGVPMSRKAQKALGGKEFPCP